MHNTIFPSLFVFLNKKNQNEITEEEIEHKLLILNTLKDQQQQLFILVVQRFIEVLNEKLNRPDVDVKIEDGEKIDPCSNPHWLKWTIERFEDVLLMVNPTIVYEIKKKKNL